MAQIKLDWKPLGGRTSVSEGADAFRNVFREVSEELSKKGVYVIRFCRPFSIAYPLAHSPVLYVGQGNTRQRVSSHMEGWVNDLSSDLPTVEIEVRYCEPRIQNNNRAHMDVEADLLDKFHTRFGALPLFNKRYEYHPRNHTYDAACLRILGPMQGRGFRWAISPLTSNKYFFRSYEEIE